MIEHYFKLAWRQLLKYKLQSLVSIVSLAIGFACFALAAMWIKYETTYDASFKDTDRIHVIVQDKSIWMHQDFSPRTLRELPQLEDLSHIYEIDIDSVNGIFQTTKVWLMNDTNFVSLTGLKLQEGNYSFVHNEHEVAISDRLARKIWGDESPVGKVLDVNCSTRLLGKQDPDYKMSRRVAAVFPYWGNHSNFVGVDVLCHKSADIPSMFLSLNAMMARISPLVDMDALNARLDTMPLYRTDLSGYEGWSEARLDQFFSHKKMKAVPITKVRHATEYYEKYAKIKINQIYLFAVAGGMLVLCALLNYLTMFINRLFIRQREIALRTVFGASGGNLMAQFLIEYGLLLVIALFFGNYATKVALNPFLEMSGLPENWDFFHRESLVFLVCVFLVSMLVSFPTIWYFRRQSLRKGITGMDGLMRYHLFRRISMGVQIGITILCIFCAVVLQKQLNTLRCGDIGFERENILLYMSSASEVGILDEFVPFLNQCPEVDTAFTCVQPIYPTAMSSYMMLTPHDFPELSGSVRMNMQFVSEALVDLYGLTLLEGRWMHGGEKNAIVVNESFVRKMGWKNPLEKEIWGHQIVGVIKDFQNISPTIKAECYRLIHEDNPVYSNGRSKYYLLLRYKPGSKPSLMSKVEAFFKERDLPYIPFRFRDAMEEYNKMLVSEDNLQKLLHITTSVCILIALFGVWSMIMLTCEQRRKEIAIRKVFGATVKDILDMFFLEYMALQGVAAVVAFPVGYACMKPWLEQYVVQTSIPWWIYVGIFMAVVLLVALCIGWRVWKTAIARPADEICKG